MKCMFYECSSVKELDLSRFDMSTVTDMSYMFNRCSTLTTIYCNDTWSCYNSNWMFYGCKALRGAIAYDESKVDVTYANPETGYFKKKLPVIEEGESITIADEIDSETNLEGNVVGDVYYNISNENGTYESGEGCIVMNSTTDDATMEELVEKNIFDDEFKNEFTGLVIKLPVGLGTVTVTASTVGSMTLKVKIGSGEPNVLRLENDEATIDYDVKEETLVYIYAGTDGESNAPSMSNRAPENASLKIYGIKNDYVGLKGDVNRDKNVTITDAVAIVNYLLGSQSDSFNTKAADVNKDNNITITDAVGVVNIILNGSEASAPQLNPEEIESQATPE